MSSDAGRAFAPLTEVGCAAPSPAGGFVLRRDDYGGFRASESGTDEVVLLRCAADGLRIERREGVETVEWRHVVGVTLCLTEAGRATVPTVRVRLSAGPSIDYADALAPGAADLPLTLAPGANRLLRAERCRLLTALIVSAAGLAPTALREFERGPRALPVPELPKRPRVVPRWVPPILFAGSVAAVALLTDLGWASALGAMSVIATHELGHAWAMRAIGLRVRGIMFVPMLGAATVAEHGFSSRWDEARVALAGPVTGLPVAAVLAIVVACVPAGHAFREPLLTALVWALGVNLINLYPVSPFDGGRALGAMTAGLGRGLRAVVHLAPILALAGAAAILLDGATLVAALVVLTVSVAITRSMLRRQSFHAWMSALPQPLAEVRTALRDVTFAWSGRASEDADGGVAPTPLTAQQLVAVMGVYAAEVVLLLLAALWFLIAVPGEFS